MCQQFVNAGTFTLAHGIGQTAKLAFIGVFAGGTYYYFNTPSTLRLSHPGFNTL
ncbi:uncharacterized protein B0H64DRAFT_441700 [Chaetomium fimeti]|uniref:Uncharacterized protein n=1 Tax=Chaetomium fimeti TaxID=1854472 RepID=A0AAE0LRZ1_9PEZI|nr:hypothetical protein B0H64DRAFT_441700 [Chaetomium fimeti]